MEKQHLKQRALGVCLTAILATSAFAVPVHAATLGGATLNTGVRLRSGAGTDFETITVGQQGEPVVVSADTGTGWYEVIYNGLKGFMSSQYLTFSQNLTAEFGVGTITGDTVRLRQGPGTDSAVLGTYDSGTAMTVTGVQGNWYQVSYLGNTGYVSSDYMTLAPEGEVYAQTLSANSTADDLIATAKGLLGTPYIYGGTTTRGFDCSGFTQYVFAQSGMTLDRTAAQQYTNNGTSVAKSELQAGDLVFFSSSSQSIGHVGMYIGDGQFIHSSSGGGKVIITSINSSYYVNHYVGAKRIF